MRFDSATNVRKWSTGRNSSDAAIEALSCDIDESLRRVVDIADAIGGVGIAVHAIEPNSDVEVHDVAVLKLAIVGDAMADDFIY